MKKITLLLMFLITSLSFSQVTIGTGNDGGTFESPPLNAYYGFSYGQSIYLASEIGANGNITSVEFQLVAGTDISSADEMLDVWIGHTSKTNFDSTSDWVDVSTLTQVLTSGTITSASDILTITFSTPFAYNGTDNIIIAVDANETGFGSSTDRVLATDGATASLSLMHRSDTNNSDPTAPEIGVLFQSRGNITFNGITQMCPTPTSVMATPTSTTEVDFTWTAGGSETGWTYEYGVTGFVEGAGTSGTTTVESLSLSSLTPGETYDIYVRANCGGTNGDSAWTTVVSFSMPLPPPPNDLPAGAIALTVDSGFACGANSITGITNQSTTDSGVTAPSCGSYGTPTERGDLWYTILAPSTGEVIFDVNNITGMTSVAGTFYSGTVGSLVEESCTEFGSGWPWTVSGLTAGDTYYVRVWDYGNDETGTFDLCAFYPTPIVPDYANDFTTFPGGGWSEASGAFMSPTGTSSSFTSDDFGNDTGHVNGQSARVNIFGTTTDEYLITPSFNLSGSTYYLNFDIAYTEFSGTAAATLGVDDFVSLLVTQDGGTTWTELTRWDTNSTISNIGESISEINLAGYGANVKLAFYAFSDTSNVDNNFYIDNFQITTTSLSVEDNKIDGFSIYPNPVNDRMQLNALDNINDISVYNLLGQEVLRMQPSISNTEVDMTDLPSGMYVVKVQVGDQLGSYKIIKE